MSCSADRLHANDELRHRHHVRLVLHQASEQLAEGCIVQHFSPPVMQHQEAVIPMSTPFYNETCTYFQHDAPYFFRNSSAASWTEYGALSVFLFLSVTLRASRYRLPVSLSTACCSSCAGNMYLSAHHTTVKQETNQRLCCELDARPEHLQSKAEKGHAPVIIVDDLLSRFRRDLLLHHHQVFSSPAARYTKFTVSNHAPCAPRGAVSSIWRTRTGAWLR